MHNHDPRGMPREITLPSGTIRYHDIGDGPPLVFVHGLLANSALWQRVIPMLAPHFRCIAPDLPLGGHTIPMPPSADLSPPGIARLVADLLTALDLDDVTLVGNDSGGAICQLVITRHPARITRLILTNCDAFEQFFPTTLKPLSYGARTFGEAFAHSVAGIFRSRIAQRALMASVSYRKFDNAALDHYFQPLLASADVRRDTNRFLASISNRYTLEAARAFANFRHPVLLVWGTNDFYFSKRLAQRLQRAFPQATLTFVERSRTFVSEDQPEELARQIEAFVGVAVHV